MLIDLTSRSFRAAIIKTILAVSLDTTLAYIIVAGDSVMWLPATNLAFHLKFSILILNTIWHCTNWWHMGTDFPYGNTSNATLTFSFFLDIASAHKVLPFLASRANACYTVLGSFMTNSWFFFKYLPYIIDYKSIWIINLHVHFLQTSAAGSKFTSNHINWLILIRAFNGVLHIPQIQKFAEMCKEWLLIQLVSKLTSLAWKEAIKGVHVKSMTFAALSWALM